MFWSHFTGACFLKSFVSSNNMSVNRAHVFHVVKNRNAEKYQSKDSDKEEGNEHYNESSGACLVSCFGGDHVSTVRALEVRYRLLSEGGCYNSSSLGDSTNLQTYTQCHRQTDTHTHARARTHEKGKRSTDVAYTLSPLRLSPDNIGRRFQSVRSVLLWAR